MLVIVTVEVLLSDTVGKSLVICGRECVERHIRTWMEGATTIESQVAAAAAGEAQVAPPRLGSFPANSLATTVASAPNTTPSASLPTSQPSTLPTTKLVYAFPQDCALTVLLLRIAAAALYRKCLTGNSRRT